MGTIAGNNTINGALGIRRNAGVPTNGTTEVQTLTFGGTWAGGDTFKLAFKGYTTTAIAWSATNATLVSNVDAALEALPSIGTGGITTAVGTMTAGIGTLTETFASGNANLAQPTITVLGVVSTAGTLAAAETTPGVNPTQLGAPKGALLQDTTNAKLYQNGGNETTPNWGLVGTQS